MWPISNMILLSLNLCATLQSCAKGEAVFIFCTPFLIKSSSTTMQPNFISGDGMLAIEKLIPRGWVDTSNCVKLDARIGV